MDIFRDASPISGASPQQRIGRRRGTAGKISLAGAIAAAVGALLMASSAANAAGQGDAPGPAAVSNDGVRRGVLPNGLTYFIDPAKRSDGKILFRLLLPVGEKDVLPREQSVAHVVEHIVFAGAHVVGRKGPMRARIERFGGVLGNDANAATATSHTSYFVKVPAARDGVLDAGIDFLADWMAPRDLTDEEIDREIQAVIEERRREATEATLDRSAAQHAAWFPGHPHYDYRPDRPDALSATPAAVRALFGQYYVPPNMAVIVAGDVDPDAALAVITAKLGAIPRGKPAPRLADAGLLPVEGGHFVPLAIDGPSESRIELTFKYRTARGGTAERARERAVALIVDRAAASLLPALFDRYDAPNRSGGLQSETMYRYPGIQMLSLQSAVRSGETRAGLAELLRIAATLRRDGFADEDIERARAAAIASLATVQIESADRLDVVYLEGAADPAPREIAAAAATVSAAEVNAALAGWLDPAHRDVFVFYPRSTEASVPSAADFAALDREATGAPSLRLTVPELRSPAFTPFVRLAVAPRSGVDIGGGYLRWTLPRSGATLIVRRSNTRDISLAMRRRGGLARADPADASLLALASDVVGRSGLAALDAFEFGRFGLARNISIVQRLALDHETLIASAPVDAWPMLLKLARAGLLQPLCRAEAFEDVRKSRLDTASVEAEFQETAAFQAMIGRSLGVVAVTVDPERLRVLDAEEICAFYARIPGDTADMVIAIESNLDPATVYQAVASVLDLPRQRDPLVKAGRAPRPDVAGHPRPTRAGRDVLRIGSRPSARIEMISRRAGGGDERPGEIVAILLSQRLNARLRAAEKGTYDVGVSFGVDDAILSISFDTGPDKVDRMIAAAKDELERLRRDGAGTDEIATARALVREAPLTPLFAAETWLKHGSFGTPPPVSDAAVRAWIARALDPALFHEFIRLPKE